MEKETKTTILEAAKSEFMEFGYEKASLRHICQRAHTTTGSLYFFFPNKEVLFDTLIHKVETTLRATLMQNAGQNRQILTDEQSLKQVTKVRMRETMGGFFEFLMDHRTESILLFRKSHGSRKETVLLDLVDQYQQAHLPYIESLAANGKLKVPLDAYSLHLYFQAQFGAVIDLVTSELTREEATRQLVFLVEMFWGAWSNLFQV